MAAKGWGTQSQSPLVPPTPLVLPGSQLLLKHGGSTPPPHKRTLFSLPSHFGPPFHLSCEHSSVFSWVYAFRVKSRVLQLPLETAGLSEAMGSRASYPPGGGEGKRNCMHRRSQRTVSSACASWVLCSFLLFETNKLNMFRLLSIHHPSSCLCRPSLPSSSHSLAHFLLHLTSEFIQQIFTSTDSRAAPIAKPPLWISPFL